MEESKVSFKGTFKKQTFRDHKSGFTYFVINTKDEVEKDSFNQVTVCAKIPDYRLGMPLHIDGVWVKDKDRKLPYVKATSVTEVNCGVLATIQFLSNSIPGVGMVMAQNIVDSFGSDIFAFVKEPDAMERLCTIQGISSDIAERIIRTVQSSIYEREMLEYLLHFGVGYSMSAKICDMYGTTALKELKKNPYEVGVKVGLDFEICDAIACENNIEPINVERIKAVLSEAFNKIAGNGHCFTYQKNLIKAAHRVEKNESFKFYIPDALYMNNLATHKDLAIEIANNEERIFSKKLRNAEINVVKQIYRLLQSAIDLPYTNDLVDYAESVCKTKYAVQQRKSFELLRKTGLVIVTGGPGTGKTTTIKGLLCSYTKMKPDAVILMAAPTGRAAQRMTESTGREASTVHKLIELHPCGDSFVCKDAEDPLECDALIIDEMSMMDIELMSFLLSAIPSGALVFLVGDVNQLSSVGPGDVLNDLIKSGVIDYVMLTEVFRQAGDSPIVSNAYLINEGNPNIVCDKSFQVFKCNTEEEAKEIVIEEVFSYWNNQKPFDVQVLTPSHKGVLGVGNLNKEVQSIVNNTSGGYIFGNTTFKVGDKVITLRNNYDKGYFNGDIGTVSAITDCGINIVIGKNEIEFSREDIDDVSLANAITIHKSQGSEYATAIVVLPASPKVMLVRNLLYTAITRGKENVILVCVGDSLKIATAVTETGTRMTALAERLVSAFKEDNCNE